MTAVAGSRTTRASCGVRGIAGGVVTGVSHCSRSVPLPDGLVSDGMLGSGAPEPVTPSEDSLLALRETPDLPDPHLQPPTVAESGDPFAAVRVVHLVARLPRGTRVRVRDIVDALNAEYVDWSFSRTVVIDVILQLQANWMADYRNVEGIVLGEDETGPTLTVEDTSRVDPWIVRQVERLASTCRERLRVFAIEEGATP